MAFLDTTQDFGQLLKQYQRQQFFSMVGDNIAALVRKSQGQPNVQMPRMGAGFDPMQAYYHRMQIAQMQEKMKAGQAERAKTAAREERWRDLFAPAGEEPGQPAAGALLGTGGGPKPGLLNIPPHLLPYVRFLGPEKGPEFLLERALKQRKAPTTREFPIAGGLQQGREWDATEGKWVDTGQPTRRWKPSERGGLTIAQERENAAIDQARQTLDQLGMSCEEIIAASQEATATRRENPNFNPYIAGLARQATKRKYGPDPDFEDRYNFLYIPTPDPSPEARAPGAAAALEPAGPNPWDRVTSMFGDGGPGGEPLTARSE